MAEMVKEKLVELLHTAHNKVADVALEDDEKTYSDAVGMEADELIAHGVTVQEWISVSERLPEYEEPVMGWDEELRDMGIVNFVYGRFFDIIDMSEVNVTHWMPLPQPSKMDGGVE